MDQCTHEVRAEYWKKIIQACGQRPAGQSAKSWIDENGICEQSYYHWQRRFRKQAYEEMKENASVPAVAEKTELTFVEIPCHTSEPDFCFCKNALRQDGYPGQGVPRKQRT